MRATTRLGGLVAFGLLTACAPYPEGLRATPAGDGPAVKVDWDAQPLPDVPFPNDLAARVDYTSPTGLRLNISLVSDTESMSEARWKLDEMTGFGVYAPITVAFEGRLDIDEIMARHTDDEKLGAERYSDDAFFVIDVDPQSPDYLQPVHLDVGDGRYPIDLPDTDRYFPVKLDGVNMPTNDTRAASPTMVFDTIDEDLNGNGVLDWGEDTDNDGILDVANIWPPGGDPRDDLLTFYELSTNTLIFRPVRPLREETTYAVVLTERLVDEAGNPVRSPWEFVNHVRQTEALSPLADALPGLGLSVDDVAFAWTFTTGRVTGDLVDVRQGLQGEGPFASLAQAYPAGVEESLVMHEMDGVDPAMLPMGTLIEQLVNLDLFDADKEGPILTANYLTFSTGVVGGSFTAPNFLADRDDEGSDTSDEWWQLDVLKGTYSAEPERIPFTCTLPAEPLVAGEPAPVVIFGHGYGSSRFDFLGFAWAFNRLGFAACANDFPGHGPTIDEDLYPLIEALLGPQGLYPFVEHLQDSRYRDLNNDGVPDSGGDQWSADAFHTRDMVRQAVVDWVQFSRSIELCGETEWVTAEGETGVSCDWDGDGVADMGGPGNELYIVGGSLGGINAGVAAGVMPEVEAFAPIVPGGGLLDVAMRTEIGGAVEAMQGRLMTPLFVGWPDAETGEVTIAQVVNSVTDMVALPVATVDSLPAGGRIVLENLHNGVVREGLIPADGSFRLPIPADGLDPTEKRHLVGMPDSGPVVGEDYTVEDTTLLGDPIVIRIYDADGNEVLTLDSWTEAVEHEGVTMPAGSTLVAGSHGSGYIRGEPDLRRLAMVFGSILEPGDPIAYAPYYDEGLIDGVPRNVAVVPTPGDMIVSINTGIAIPRAAGWIEQDELDERYGMTIDDWLVENRVLQGIEEVGPFTCADGNPCLFDADDLDNGTDGTGAPSDEPLRITVETDSGMSGLRLPYAKKTGSHGFFFPDPTADFDINTFAIMQISSYFATGGTLLTDDVCLEDASCDWIPQLPDDGEDTGGAK